MAEVEEHDYETITVRCDSCDETRVYSRIDDIGHPGPYAGERIKCLACGELFWINGDIINPAYQLFLFDADRHVAAKHYILALTSLTQAWESFFVHFLHAHLAWRPCLAGDFPMVPRMNRIIARVQQRVERCGFERLRNIVLNVIISGATPLTLPEAEAAITAVEAPEYHFQPSLAAIEPIHDVESREIAAALNELTVGRLRNRAVHHSAYRPCREEVMRCADEEVRLMYRCKHHFAIGTGLDYQAGSVPLRPSALRRVVD